MTNISMPGDTGPRTTSLNVTELGWIEQIACPDGLYETFIHDPEGNVITNVDCAGRTNIYTYAHARKLTSVILPLATGQRLTNNISYDEQFNTLYLTDAKNRPVETYQMDLQDRPVIVTNLEGQAMSITYGLGKRAKTITRFDGTVVSNMYNADGLVSAVAYPGTTNRFTYLKNGLLRTASNQVCVVSNTWDFANRLTAQTSVASVTSVVSYSHYPAGQVSNVISVCGTNTCTLDAAGRISRLQAPCFGAVPVKFDYTYNTNNGLVSTMIASKIISGLRAYYSFDMMDRITNIVWRNSSLSIVRSFGYQYNAADMITNVVREDGSVVEYGYDSLDRLISEKKTLAGATVYEQTFGYDEVGNRTVKTNGSATVSYSYSNGCNRLTGWGAASTNDFYDVRCLEVIGCSTEAIGTNAALGQLCVSNYTGGAGITPSVSGTNFSGSLPVTPTNGTYSIRAAIGDVAGNVGYATNTASVWVVTNTSYQFNTAGCITNIAQTGSGFTQTLSLVWNGQYQITEAKTNGYSVEKYGFDAYGRRAWTAQGTVTNFHVYDGVHCIADRNATGGLVRTYTWGPGIDNMLAMTVHTGATAVTYFPITDHLGTIHAMATFSGAVVESYKFDAWGRVLGVYDTNGVRLADSALGNRYLWQGREYSWATGLYFFRARWYDPITGRWLSNDPIGISGGLNQYCFCADNPVNFRDPLGLCSDEESWGAYAALSKAESIGAAPGLDERIARALGMTTEEYRELMERCNMMSSGTAGGMGRLGGAAARRVSKMVVGKAKELFKNQLKQGKIPVPAPNDPTERVIQETVERVAEKDPFAKFMQTTADFLDGLGGSK